MNNNLSRFSLQEITLESDDEAYQIPLIRLRVVLIILAKLYLNVRSETKLTPSLRRSHSPPNSLRYFPRECFSLASPSAQRPLQRSSQTGRRGVPPPDRTSHSIPQRRHSRCRGTEAGSPQEPVHEFEGRGIQRDYSLQETHPEGKGRSQYRKQAHLSRRSGEETKRNGVTVLGTTGDWSGSD